MLYIIELYMHKLIRSRRLELQHHICTIWAVYTVIIKVSKKHLAHNVNIIINRVM